MLDSDRSIEARLLRDNEEGPDRAARRRASGQPLVDILLGTRSDGALVGLVQPHEELHRFGDLLLRRVDRAVSGVGRTREQSVLEAFGAGATGVNGCAG